MTLDRVSWRRGEITVADIRSKSGIAQPFSHFDCRGHRAVAPPCTSECNGHVTFARGPVAGNPVDEKRLDALHRLGPGRLTIEIVADRLILAAEWAKIVLPVRIRKKAHVEDK